ncbi:hypothetical protein ACN9ML_14005 [Dyadobacter endophyticus]|uniref:hypothetical protein n=1 Tax=Dyadobacter endophyticus TaxID=1749036 RepID=UPI003CE69EF2
MKSGGQYPRNFHCIKGFYENWHVSAAVNVGQYSSQRESAEALSDDRQDENQFELKTFPNPYIDGFSVEFSILDNVIDVTLEIVDNKGYIIKKIVENPHVKGRWKYPVRDL